MKKFTLLIFVLTLGLFSFAQPFLIETLDGGTIENGGELKITHELDTDIEITVYVKNISDVLISTGIRVEHLEESTISKEDVLVSICWGELCYAPWVFLETPVDIGPDIKNDFKMSHNEPSVQGETKFKITFFDADNEDDKIEFFLTFEVGSVGINKVADAKINAYPNPATTNLTIEYDLNRMVNEVQISLTNLLGVEVLREKMNNQAGSARIDVSGFAPGIYFYTVKADGKVVETKKVVVSR